jgi:hypothetical protein
VELITITKDKQGRPVAQLDLSTEEIDVIKKAAENHPKHDDPDAEGMRIRGLLERDYSKPFPNIVITDMKEVVNKQRQEEPDPSLDVLYDELHRVWVSLNPS